MHENGSCLRRSHVISLENSYEILIKFLTSFRLNDRLVSALHRSQIHHNVTKAVELIHHLRHHQHCF